ncbi:universal stress protein [Nitrosovibrio sp. Nv17]|jgi:nucleotide-binding universal stress UspA family protein|uniref:universal stress protein n=1 Tax=Nitrosovibrio sp. Nv17 TaxID=1855339 RepID=UPI0009087429|nr:universal stress protein [Nitrosovibrio sp. Nv17]SFW19915.1 Nucleotide-binding universal stress protein, UspA family [Nitrosovibrio sp. Nv17]
MLKFLLPVDGSEASNRAISGLIGRLEWYRETPEIHLLNVQFPQHGNVTRFIGRENVEQYHQEEGMKGLGPARALLEEAGLVCRYHITVGIPEEVITRYAMEMGFDLIVIGPRGLGMVKGLLLGSVASRVMQLSTVPVLLIR